MKTKRQVWSNAPQKLNINYIPHKMNVQNKMNVQKPTDMNELLAKMADWNAGLAKMNVQMPAMNELEKKNQELKKENEELRTQVNNNQYLKKIEQMEAKMNELEKKNQDLEKANTGLREEIKIHKELNYKSNLATSMNALKGAMAELIQKTTETGNIKDDLRHKILARLENIGKNFDKIKDLEIILKLTEKVEKLAQDPKITKGKIEDLADLLEEHTGEFMIMMLTDAIYDNPLLEGLSTGLPLEFFAENDVQLAGDSAFGG